MPEIKKRKGLIISLSGPSGVGKDTVIQRIMSERLNMVHSISMTTRQLRGEEKEAVDYYFVGKDEFLQLYQAGEIAECDEYLGDYYGTPIRPLREWVEEGIDVILDITVPGALEIKSKFPEAIIVFLLPPSLAALEKRLRRRGTENEDLIRQRLSFAAEEISQADKFDYAVVNDDLDLTVETLLAILTAEENKCSRQTYAIGQAELEFEDYA